MSLKAKKSPSQLCSGTLNLPETEPKGQLQHTVKLLSRKPLPSNARGAQTGRGTAIVRLHLIKDYQQRESCLQPVCLVLIEAAALSIKMISGQAHLIVVSVSCVSFVLGVRPCDGWLSQAKVATTTVSGLHLNRYHTLQPTTK